MTHSNETKQTSKKNPYGHCPQCGAKGKSRERRPNGNDECEQGHTYPSRDAVMKNKQTSAVCKECGMPVRRGDYHPYAACLMFKQCQDSKTVEDNLQAVVKYGFKMAKDLK